MILAIRARVQLTAQMDTFPLNALSSSSGSMRVYYTSRIREFYFNTSAGAPRALGGGGGACGACFARRVFLVALLFDSL